MEYFYKFLDLKPVYNYLIKLLKNGYILTYAEQKFYNLYYKSIPTINKQHLLYFDVEFYPITFEIKTFEDIHLRQLKKIISLTCYQ